jgi:hypothetical protein
MKKIALFLSLSLLAIKPNSTAQSGTPAAGSISPALILERYLSATGGVNAHKDLLTLKATGNFGFSLYHPTGNYMFLYKAPANDMLEVQMISHGTSWFGRRNEHRIKRWTVEGAGMINGAGMQLVEQSLASLLEWDIREYKKIELIGRAQVEKRWAFAVRFTPRQGDSQVRYYDMENHLMVRMDQVQRMKQANNIPEMAYAVTTYFRDYRQYGALKLPQHIAVSRDVGDLLFELDSVKTGVEIPDSEFRD